MHSLDKPSSVINQSPDAEAMLSETSAFFAQSGPFQCLNQAINKIKIASQFNKQIHALFVGNNKADMGAEFGQVYMGLGFMTGDGVAAGTLDTILKLTVTSFAGMNSECGKQDASNITLLEALDLYGKDMRQELEKLEASSDDKDKVSALVSALDEYDACLKQIGRFIDRAQHYQGILVGPLPNIDPPGVPQR